jgi:hypothetical protein
VRRLDVHEAEQWVAFYLGEYCPPGEHHFVSASATLRWCTVCYKEESRADETCLICDASGAAAGELRCNGSTQAQGRLCPDCDLGIRSGGARDLGPWAFSPGL